MMMNVDVALAVCFGLTVFGLCVATFFLMNMRANFTNAKPNSVYNFDYIQPLSGTRERFLAKVVSNESWTNDEIENLNVRSRYRKYDSMFARKGRLVNCVMPNGEYRRFWSDRVENCKLVPVGGILYRFASLI